jgi:hypothetical protein
LPDRKASGLSLAHRGCLLRFRSIQLNQQKLALKWSRIISLNASVNQPVRFPVHIDDALDSYDLPLARDEIDIAYLDVICELPATLG